MITLINTELCFYAKKRPTHDMPHVYMQYIIVIVIQANTVA